MGYKTLFTEPIMETLHYIMGYLPKLTIALAVLIVGWVLAKLITKLFITFLRTIDFDKISGKMGLTKVLKTGGIIQKPSTLFGCMVYWVLMVAVLITHVQALGIDVASSLLASVLGYIPHVIVGGVVLVVGMLIAQLVSVIIYVIAKNTDMPIPETISKLSKWSIVFFVSILYLKEIGFVALFTGASYTIFMAGIVFAFALAFGLAGKDIAAKYLMVFSKK
jgi:hypothetical protein